MNRILQYRIMSEIQGDVDDVPKRELIIKRKNFDTQLISVAEILELLENGLFFAKKNSDLFLKSDVIKTFHTEETIQSLREENDFWIELLNNELNFYRTHFDLSSIE